MTLVLSLGLLGGTFAPVVAETLLDRSAAHTIAAKAYPDLQPAQLELIVDIVVNLSQVEVWKETTVNPRVLRVLERREKQLYDTADITYLYLSFQPTVRLVREKIAAYQGGPVAPVDVLPMCRLVFDTDTELDARYRDRLPMDLSWNPQAPRSGQSPVIDVYPTEAEYEMMAHAGDFAIEAQYLLRDISYELLDAMRDCNRFQRSLNQPEL